MPGEYSILILSAITIACVHTAAGPDHYLPFIALSKARRWSLARTIWWTVVCGMGHILSSVLLAGTAAALGWSINKIKWLENVRGGLAGWSLLVFGLCYTIWGIIKATRFASHKHFDVQQTGDVYVFSHTHGGAVYPTERFKVTPWVLFIIFVLGPCEPLIPLLYLPAVNNAFYPILLVVGVYAFFTLTTMVAMVLLGYYGLTFLNTQKLEQHMHTLAGFALLMCGAGMVFLQW
jgi:sulfite exporter TauE/SafE